MPYIPKSQITILNTNGGLLVFKNSKKSYRGLYIKVNDGRYFAGTSNVDIGSELILKDKNTGFKKSFGFNKDVLKYKILKKSIKNRLSKATSLPTVKSTPSESDYRRGYYQRYFSKRINGNNYLEISKDTYDSIKKRELKYDYNLYSVGSIRWYITGNDVHRQNSLEIIKTERFFPNIFYLFPILNEFLQPSTEVQENLYTNGG